MVVNSIKLCQGEKMTSIYTSFSTTQEFTVVNRYTKLMFPSLSLDLSESASSTPTNDNREEVSASAAVQTVVYIL